MKLSIRNRIVSIFASIMLIISSIAVAMPIYASGDGVDAGAETVEESFAGVKVSEGGSVSLKYCYSSLGDADSVVVIRKSPVGVELDREILNVSDIPTDDDGNRVITVKLAAAEMTDTVTVYTQKSGKRLGEEHTYSVMSYAEKVLADDAYSEYHKGLKSLLNYGAMAQRYFSVNTADLANASLYRNGTNPVGAVDKIDCEAPAWTNGEKLVFTGYEAVLEGDTAFRIYFAYSGENKNGLVASVEGEEKIYFDSESGTYYVKITNIAPTLYAKQYTVKVSDGSDEMTVSASMLNYLDDVISSNGTSEAQKNTARAMYQHYVWLAKVAPYAPDCEHKTLHQENSNNGRATAYVCSLCGAVTQKIGDSVEINGSAEYVASEYLKSDSAQKAEVLTDPDGTVFARIHGGRPAGSYNSLYFHASTSKECGRYVVMKIRTPENNPSNFPGKFHMFVKSTGEGADWQKVEFTAPTDGEWHTVVLDLTDFANKYTAAYDGKYYTQMLWLRPLTYGANVGTVDDVIDIAYISMCNELGDALEIIDGATYERHLSSSNYIVLDAKSGKCFGKCLLEHTSDGAKHTYKCNVCGSVDSEITVDESLNYYSAPGTIKAQSGDVYGSLTDGNAYYEDGEIFQRIEVKNGGGTIPLTAGGGADEKHIVKVNGSTGKYFVFRMRTHNIENVVGLSWRIASVGEGDTFTKPGSYVAERRVFEDDVWVTYVVDIASLGITGYSVNNTDKTNIVAALMVRADEASSGAALNDTYIDFSYFAICDDWNEIDIATGDERTVFLTEWKGNAELKEVGSAGACPNDSCVYELDDSDGIKYVCSVCMSAITVEVDESINFYSAPGQTMNNQSAGYNGNVEADWDHDIRCEDGKIYEHIALGACSSFKFDNGTSELCRRFPATSAVKGGSGRYLVIRMRTHNIDSAEEIRIMMNSDTSSQGSNTKLNSLSSNTVLRTADFTDGVWQTYVIDLKALGHPYYTAEDEGVQKIAVGFYFPGLTAADEASMDVEYVAICDDWSEIDKVVEEKVVMLSGWANNDPWTYAATADGGLPVFTEGADADKVIYEKRGEELYVYIRSPYSESYTRYKFSHNKKDNINTDTWQLLSVAICNTDLEVLYYASREGATDLDGVVQEYRNGAIEKDFIGGQHGDENYKSLTVTVDGVELDMSRDHVLASCESIVATVTSDVFRCETTEKVFDRTKVLTWTASGMEIDNTYTAVTDVTIYRPALGMLVVYRDDSGYNDVVTKHWDNISQTWIDVVWPAQPTGNYHRDGMTYAELEGDYIKASLEIKDFTINGVATATKGWFNYDSWSVGNQRVKIYLDMFRIRAFVPGDIMHCTAVHTTFAK